MSGGYWDYGQYQINNIVDNLIETDSDAIEMMDDQMKLNLLKLIHSLEIASVHMQRLDWFLSGDDGMETYHKRLKDEEEFTKLILTSLTVENGKVSTK